MNQRCCLSVSVVPFDRHGNSNANSNSNANNSNNSKSKKNNVKFVIFNDLGLNLL